MRGDPHLYELRLDLPGEHAAGAILGADARQLGVVVLQEAKPLHCFGDRFR